MNDCCRHGTAVAGCVGAQIDGVGAVGVAPGCTTASVSISVPTCPFDGTSQTTTSWFIAALDYAQQIGARVTNASFSSGLVSSAWESKYASTRAAGVFHVASSGNEGVNTVAYPASIASVCAIGAVQLDGQLADFGGGQGSNTGLGLQFVAPGKHIWTTDRTGSLGYSNGDYTVFSGTSAAAPYAAGVAALVASADPTVTPSEIEYVLEMSCRDLGTAGYDTNFGYGLLNANKALQVVLNDLDALRTSFVVVNPVLPLGNNTIAKGVNSVAPGGLVIARQAVYDEALVVTKPLVLRKWDGTVVVE